jgi:hypothetical protein
MNNIDIKYKSYDSKGLKICSDCNYSKELELFPKNKSKYDGLSNVCKVCSNIRHGIYRRNNKEKESARRRDRYIRNKEREISYDNAYKKMKCISDPSYRLLRSLRDRHSKAVKNSGNNKTFRTTDLLGCDSYYLKRYIEVQFKGDMSWSNYGILWSIDHIYPLSKIDWSDIYEKHKYCHYSNLQPMLAMDNIRKGNRVYK